MGIFGPFVYENGKGEKFWLHVKNRGKSKLYYFSKDPEGALEEVPKGWEVVENPRSGLPLLRKSEGEGGLLSGLLKGSKRKVLKEDVKKKKK